MRMSSKWKADVLSGFATGLRDEMQRKEVWSELMGLEGGEAGKVLVCWWL